MSQPIGNLSDLQDLLENGVSYMYGDNTFAVYSVLLYTRTEGLNRRLHEYVWKHFDQFRKQTGPNWLVAIVEIPGRTPEEEPKFKPESVYEIARYLGAGADDIPAIIFFTDPKERKETLILQLRDIFPSGEPKDDDLEQFFAKVATMIDNMCKTDRTNGEMLSVLRKQIEEKFGEDPQWAKGLESAMGWVKTSAVAATSVFGAIAALVKLL
ncbi:hypothetical protein [Tunturiibacter gelidiferens]|uniref:hypothetical protein n=1 Tax=Tunturiibacter gelidiferens TaxID=3069689 RepID=UPI003D9B712E